MVQIHTEKYEINESLGTNDKLFRRRPLHLHPSPDSFFPELHNSHDFHHICLRQCAKQTEVISFKQYPWNFSNSPMQFAASKVIRRASSLFRTEVALPLYLNPHYALLLASSLGMVTSRQSITKHRVIN